MSLLAVRYPSQKAALRVSSFSTGVAVVTSLRPLLGVRGTIGDNSGHREEQ